MKKLPFYIRLGFAIMGKGFNYDPFAVPATQPVRVQTPETSELRIPMTPTSQIAWTPTKTTPPELHKKVTIYTSDNETLHGWARVNDHDYIHSTDDRTINNVTHWMDVGSPTRIKDTTQPSSQIANKPRMPR